MWTDQERRIFGPYFDGKASVHADPMAVDRRLKKALGGDVNAVLQRYRSDCEMEALDATDLIVLAAYVAFDLQPFDKATGAGVVETEAVDILFRFFDWTEKKNASGETPPTLPASSPSPSPIPSTVTTACG